MEWNQQPANEARDTSEPAGSAKMRPTSGCRPTWGCRSCLLTCGVLYFIMTILATVKWSFWRPTAMDGVALFPNGQSAMRNLAVVVPTHSGDLEGAIAALELWPKVCSAPTLHHMHLVVYYSGSAGDGVWNEDIISTVARTGGRCFERTKAVFANLTKQENVYPKGPSVMFYKMFLDRDVARALEGYDALAVVEWDVVVAHPTSFEMLYKSAFFSSEEFWMKGSTLAGAEFHETAGLSEMWHILGHLNGNAIYNNTDPGFHEFVNFTLNRWQYQYSYDVALWATIADFPYSWPLWQRYSSKFVATQLIANVGFHDVSQPEVGMAVSRNTLFIHGSTGGGGGTTNHAVAHAKARVAAVAPDCARACGGAGKLEISGMSTFCDASCLLRWSPAGPRFGGHGCGADDPTRFGEDCRRCYTSQEAALAEERKLSSPDNMGPNTGVHVVMCSTGSPPAAKSECSDECVSTGDAVCDYRCGRGVYGDLHCNWRGLGQNCRFCFRDYFDAHLADEISKTNGSRVIMCDTHEPPLAIGSNPTLELGSVGKTEPPTALPSGAATEASAVDVASTALTDSAAFSGNIARGEMCAFMVGYFAFLEETSVGVSSVLHFMPGMKVGIATHPTDFDVFNRTLGKFPTVSVINASRVEHSAVHADKACGPRTRLIYYMEVGEVLSRPFTPKDTHSSRGDLIVSFTSSESGHQECDRQAKAADILLGFYPPCFTYGSDLILPAELNQQLRGIVRARTRTNKGGPGNDLADDLTGDLAALAASHNEYASVHVPEVLASLAFAHNHKSVVFHNPREWSVDNMFVAHSIWDVPLVKPRFGCTYDMALVQQGYDLGKRMAQEFESFKLGLGKCEMGFRDVQPFELDLKANQEFGVDGALQDMPDLQDFHVSIMYRTFNSDAELFNMSIQSVMEHFPSAHEVVVVVIEEDETFFKRILDGYRASAPFQLHLVTERDQMDGRVQHKYSKLRADLYTAGDYILHMDSDGILFEDITYDHIFHLRKPVLPFRRYRNETTEGFQTMLCWQNGTSFAVGEEVLHEFSLFTNHVYPRSLYRAARRFIEEHHQKSLVDFMSTRRGSCMHPNTMAKWTVKQRDRMFSDFNFLGAYLWYHMHDAVYWVAGDPLDTQPGDWRPDLVKFAWVCQAGGGDAPKDAAGMKQFVADFRMVRNQTQCLLVRNHWRERDMKDPATRSKIDTSSEEWNQA